MCTPSLASLESETETDNNHKGLNPLQGIGNLNHEPEPYWFEQSIDWWIVSFLRLSETYTQYTVSDSRIRNICYTSYFKHTLYVIFYYDSILLGDYNIMLCGRFDGKFRGVSTGTWFWADRRCRRIAPPSNRPVTQQLTYLYNQVFSPQRLISVLFPSLYCWRTC